jgi:hypothetical protein
MERMVVIDLPIRPADAEGQLINAFPSGSPWLELWGSGVVQDHNDHDLVAIRTSFKCSSWLNLVERFFAERAQEVLH